VVDQTRFDSLPLPCCPARPCGLLQQPERTAPHCQRAGFLHGQAHRRVQQAKLGRQRLGAGWLCAWMGRAGIPGHLRRSTAAWRASISSTAAWADLKLSSRRCGRMWALHPVRPAGAHCASAPVLNAGSLNFASAQPISSWTCWSGTLLSQPPMQYDAGIATLEFPSWISAIRCL